MNAMKRILGIAVPVPALWSASAWGALYFSFAEPALDPTFSSYSIPLTAGVGWKSGALNGPNATPGEIASTLGALSELSIHLLASSNQYFLDNVALHSGLGTILAESTFPRCDAQGWKLVGFGTSGCNTLFGNPPGSTTNGAVTPSFFGPAAFLGDKSAAVLRASI